MRDFWEGFKIGLSFLLPTKEEIDMEAIGGVTAILFFIMIMVLIVFGIAAIIRFF